MAKAKPIPAFSLYQPTGYALNPYGYADPTYSSEPGPDSNVYPFLPPADTYRKQRDGAYDQGLDMGDGECARQFRAPVARVKGRK